VYVQTPYDPELRNFDALVDRLQVLDGDALLLLTQKEHERSVREGEVAEWDARRSLPTNVEIGNTKVSIGTREMAKYQPAI